jgi:hypothetical protein
MIASFRVFLRILEQDPETQLNLCALSQLP